MQCCREDSLQSVESGGVIYYDNKKLGKIECLNLDNLLSKERKVGNEK